MRAEGDEFQFKGPRLAADGETSWTHDSFKQFDFYSVSEKKREKGKQEVFQRLNKFEWPTKVGKI